MAVRFFSNDGIKVPLKNKRKLGQFIKEMFISQKKIVKSLSIIFCDDEFLLRVNKDFLQHDYYTDIITFDLSENENFVEAELYISIERVIENAKRGKIMFNKELHRVIAHGVLHLTGLKDKKPTDKILMTEMEDNFLLKYLK